MVDEWTAARTAARTYLVRGDFSGLGPIHNLSKALIKAALRNQLSTVMWVDRPSHTTACTTVTSGAQAYFTIASATESWQARLQATTDVLIRFGPHLDVGMIRATEPYGNSWASVRGTPPEPPSDIAGTDDLRLARRYVLDAYGTQDSPGRISNTPETCPAGTSPNWAMTGVWSVTPIRKRGTPTTHPTRPSSLGRGRTSATSSSPTRSTGPSEPRTALAASRPDLLCSALYASIGQALEVGLQSVAPAADLLFRAVQRPSPGGSCRSIRQHP